MAHSLLEGKKGVVLGVANKRSIAWAIARAAADQGGRLALTYQGEKLLSRVEPLAAELPAPCPIYSCDVSNDSDLDSLASSLQRDFEQIDFVVHSIAYAEKTDLEGRFIDTSRKGYLLAQEVSSYSLVAVSRVLAPLMPPGSSIVTLTYLGGERVVKNYNVMGVAKAALESSVRYLAADLGGSGIRVNAVSAGPVNTLAARGISGFTDMLAHVAQLAPLKRNVEIEEVANAAAFLLSPLASGITGETVYVDCGYNILGM